MDELKRDETLATTMVSSQGLHIVVLWGLWGDRSLQLLKVLRGSRLRGRKRRKVTPRTRLSNEPAHLNDRGHIDHRQ